MKYSNRKKIIQLELTYLTIRKLVSNNFNKSQRIEIVKIILQFFFLWNIIN